MMEETEAMKQCTTISNKNYNILYVHLFIHVASQMWCLARLLPIMIGDRIPENDLNWENFLLLLKIADYILAPVTSRSIAAQLTTLIEDYLQSFRELYPECSIIPKQHYMVHIPQWMLRYVHILSSLFRFSTSIS